MTIDRKTEMLVLAAGPRVAAKIRAELERRGVKLAWRPGTEPIAELPSAIAAAVLSALGQVATQEIVDLLDELAKLSKPQG